MDTITHTLSGALLARATPRMSARLSQRARLGAASLTAAFPDSDIVIRFFTDPLTYLNLHRGVTHSVVMLPVWALLLSLLYARFSRYHWRDFIGVTALSLGIHILGDVITVYGTKILMPFSHWKATVPTTFIIDPVVTIILAGGLLLAATTRVPARAARGAYAVLIAYIGMQGVMLMQAQELGETYARAQQFHGAKVHALPQPLSPFHWKIVVENRDDYQAAYVNLLRRDTLPVTAGDGWFQRTRALYRPADRLAWETYHRHSQDPEQRTFTLTAWQLENFRGFREFAGLPYLHDVKNSEGKMCAWFGDLRFVISSMTPPFRFGMCRDLQNGNWIMRRLSRFD